MSVDTQSTSLYHSDAAATALSQAIGSAIPGAALLAGFSDGTNVQAALVDAAGRQVVAGAAADGAAVAGAPVLMGGSDGANARTLATDTGGRQVMVGAADAGTAEAGAPVLMGGTDGTNARSLLTDTGGRQVMVGAAADGTAVTGAPVLMGGSDGTNAQTLSTDTAGRLNVNAQFAKSGTSTTSATALSTTNATVLAANADRTGAILYNDSNTPAFVKFGATATTSDFTIRLPSRGYLEVPFSYTGIIDAILQSGTGSMKATELEV